ncbi:hypothetical protein J2W51_004004 [Tardiphaga robiniae]|uniref:hypothetical protein n=1 Tax=Tardiphaga robiniae TaxID=943830 RepID=UPI002857BF41|nr:hypothetical protein [Tardiphaga robiniae]MDR6661418.1 hypothetical protein [Tardiphaga robiniae]
MGTYSITGGQQGAVGDNARAENFTQISGLAQELNELAAEMGRQARTTEQHQAVKSMTEADQAVRDGDKETASEKIKAAGAWALKVATDLGKDVAAKVIASQLGL